MATTSYFNQKLSVSVVVPEDWTGRQISDTKFRLLGAPESGLEAYFDEYRVSMSYELLQSPNTFGEWFQELIASNNSTMANSYNEYTLLSESFYELDTHPVYRKVYTWLEEETGLRLYQIQAFIYAGSGALYLINAAVVEMFSDRYLPVFESVLDSTRIIPPA